MNTPGNPPAIHPPLGRYHHTVRVPGGSELLVVAGQVGAQPDGTVPAGIQAQSEQALRNLLACLEANGYGRADLVKLNIYLTDSRFLPEFRAARAAVLGDDTQPASTLVVVAGLASPDLLVEVEAWAAKG